MGDRRCCCGTCGCPPECGTTAAVVVTFHTSPPWDCSALDGLEFTLPRLGTRQVWRLVLDDDPCFGDATIEFMCSLYDPFNAWASYTLSIKWDGDEDTGQCFTSSQGDPQTLYLTMETGTCDPFCLTTVTGTIYPSLQGLPDEPEWDCCVCANYKVDIYATICCASGCPEC